MNEPAITPPQSSTIKKNKGGYLLVTSYKHTSSVCDQSVQETGVHCWQTKWKFVINYTVGWDMASWKQKISYSSFSFFFSYAVYWWSCSFQVTQWASFIRRFFRKLRAYEKCEPPPSANNIFKFWIRSCMKKSSWCFLELIYDVHLTQP